MEELTGVSSLTCSTEVSGTFAVGGMEGTHLESRLGPRAK